MKKALLIINIVLIVLVGYLYYLNFSKGTKEFKKEVKINSTATNSDAGIKVAYFELDSLQNHYSYFKKLKAEFEKKQAAANSELIGLQKKYQSRAAELQKKAQTMTPQEQEAAMNEMNEMQQNLQVRKQNSDNELFNYNSKMNDDILNRIQNFLKKYNSDGKYSYVFSYQPGLMFYKDSTLDITADVIKGLNELDAEKKK
jgi:outer membrane protein